MTAVGGLPADDTRSSRVSMLLDPGGGVKMRGRDGRHGGAADQRGARRKYET
jgi:hypothetical protein